MPQQPCKPPAAPLPVVLTPETAGNPWDAWDDRRHGASDVALPRYSEAAYLRWETLLGQR